MVQRFEEIVACFKVTRNVNNGIFCYIQDWVDDMKLFSHYGLL